MMSVSPRRHLERSSCRWKGSSSHVGTTKAKERLRPLAWLGLGWGLGWGLGFGLGLRSGFAFGLGLALGLGLGLGLEAPARGLARVQ